MHYILRQLKCFITNDDTFWSFYKHVKNLLQITAGITNCGVITSYVVTKTTAG